MKKHRKKSLWVIACFQWNNHSHIYAVCLHRGLGYSCQETVFKKSCLYVITLQSGILQGANRSPHSHGTDPRGQQAAWKEGGGRKMVFLGTWRDDCAYSDPRKAQGQSWGGDAVGTSLPARVWLSEMQSWPSTIWKIPSVILVWMTVAFCFSELLAHLVLGAGWSKSLGFPLAEPGHL